NPIFKDMKKSLLEALLCLDQKKDFPCNPRSIAMLLLLIASLQAFQLQAADTLTKGESITVNFEGTTLKDALSIIEKETPYKFFYNHRAIDVNQEVNVRLTDVPVEVAIGALLKDAGVVWRIKGSQVVLRKPKNTLPEPALPIEASVSTSASNAIAVSPRTESVAFLKYDLVVSGRITDEDGLPLPGVNVIIKGTTIG